MADVYCKALLPLRLSSYSFSVVKDSFQLCCSSCRLVKTSTMHALGACNVKCEQCR